MTKQECYKLREHINAAIVESSRQSMSGKSDKEYEAYMLFQRRIVKASQDLEKFLQEIA